MGTGYSNYEIKLKNQEKRINIRKLEIQIIKNTKELEKYEKLYGKPIGTTDLETLAINLEYENFVRAKWVAEDLTNSIKQN